MEVKKLSEEKQKLKLENMKQLEVIKKLETKMSAQQSNNNGMLSPVSTVLNSSRIVNRYQLPVQIPERNNPHNLTLYDQPPVLNTTRDMNIPDLIEHKHQPAQNPQLSNMIRDYKTENERFSMKMQELQQKIKNTSMEV